MPEGLPAGLQMPPALATSEMARTWWARGAWDGFEGKPPLNFAELFNEHGRTVADNYRNGYQAGAKRA